MRESGQDGRASKINQFDMVCFTFEKGGSIRWSRRGGLAHLRVLLNPPFAREGRAWTSITTRSESLFDIIDANVNNNNNTYLHAYSIDSDGKNKLPYGGRSLRIYRQWPAICYVNDTIERMSMGVTVRDRIQ